MGRPAAPSQIKRHTEQRRRGRGSPQHPFSVFFLRGRPVRSMRACPEKGPLESRSPAILRTQEKPPEYCRGLFLLRALSIKKDTESTVQAIQPATRRTTFFLWLCHSIWLLHLYNAVKMQTFSQDFPLAESRAKAFCRLSLWNFKEKTAIIFYDTAFPIQRNSCTGLGFASKTAPFLHIKELLPHGLPTSQSFCGRGFGGGRFFQKASSPDFLPFTPSRPQRGRP